MYDKDDFPFDDFDNTQYSAEQRKDSRKYKVAWSNEALSYGLFYIFRNCMSILEERHT